MTIFVRRSVLIAVLFWVSTATAGEVYRTVENKELTGRSPDLTQAIISHRSFSVYKSLGCRLIGERIDLDGRGKVFLFTTEDACGWGSALGPIWIVRVGNDHVGKAVLDAGGYSVVGKSGFSRGMRNIEVRSGNAAFIATQSYRFDGVRYRAVGSRRGAGAPDGVVD
ncbi:hypothetical protein [Burkholderia cepacia]|uniref:hypothetical protein n=1 Tax=Burkholderia cepacia TaxID=292 RepID=UPI0012D8795F|nr:hypothetical protein [Burkholderia cepacia]